jgi:hypothetical protein
MNEARLIRVGLMNLIPDDARTPIKPIIVLWEQIESFFTGYKISARAYDASKSAEYQVDLDASQVINDLRIADEFDNTASDREYLLKKIALQDDQKCGLTLDFKLTAINQAARDCPHTPLRLIEMLLQQIYISANLCLPGSSKLYKITYPDLDTKSPPSLHSIYFEDCIRFAIEGGWPQYKILPFESAWGWLIACGVHDLDIARTPVQRAIFSLLELARYEAFNLAEVLFISQALEGLLVKEGEPSQRTLSRRIKAIVGVPANHQNWVKEFYELRSNIVHGSYPIVREKAAHEENREITQYNEDYYLPMVRAVAALIAILQDMICEGAGEYRFEQHETVSRINVTDE